MSQEPPAAANERWFVFQRWAQFEGELRSSLLRIASIALFYGIHLWRYFSAKGWLPDWGLLQIHQGAEIDQRYHLLVTLLITAWTLLSVNVYLMLRNRMFPRWLPWATSAMDAIFLTAIICISQGPQSPLVAIYFLLIALAGLRFSLPIVQMTTVAAVMGYLCALGVAKWPERFGRSAEIEISVPRYHQVIVTAAIVIAGVLIGQMVRRVRTFVNDEPASSEG